MIKFRLATLKDAEEIHKLLWSVYDQLPDKSTFVPDSLEYVEEHIEKRGFILIGYDTEKDNAIVCYFLVHYPDLDPDNMGRDIHLEKEELHKVVHMDSCVVDPAYRGQRLQQTLFALAEEYADKSKYTYLMGTAAPNNYASCRSFEKSGYECIATKEKYGGKLRNIYLKQI